MFRKVFLDHPRSVGETYFQHFWHALSFSLKMFYGGIACFMHALIPCLCERTGSNAIITLHDRMVSNRANLTKNKKFPTDTEKQAA